MAPRSPYVTYPPAADQPARLLHDLGVHLQSRLYELPAHTLDIVPAPQAGAAWPRELAARCFGDPGLVYDVTARLTAPGIHDVGIALGGPPPGFAAPPGESLAGFIARAGQGVIVFDDLQAFDERAISTLAQIVDIGMACPEGSASPSLRAERFAVLAFARMALPSPRALLQAAGLSAPWPPGGAVPRSFADAVEAAARQQYPEHFRQWVAARFEGVDAGFAWDRYLALSAAGALDTPLFDAPHDVAAMTPPAPPAPRDQVDDVAVITPLAAPAEPFDVFISYSWSRTADDATWLRDHLRAQGLRVFFDKDHLDVSQVPEGSVKEVLIQHLRATVESARAWIVFAAALQPFVLPAGMSREDALRRGLAMETDDPLAVLVAWSWQTLEMRHMGPRLVIGEQAAYMVNAHGSYDHAFGERPAPGREAIAEHVAAYLRTRGITV